MRALFLQQATLRFGCFETIPAAISDDAGLELYKLSEPVGIGLQDSIGSEVESQHNKEHAI